MAPFKDNGSSSDANTEARAPQGEALSRQIHPADLRGTVQLATDGTREATRLVEGLHATGQSVIRSGTPTGRSRTTGLTGWIYQTVRQTTGVPGTVQPSSGPSGPSGTRH